MADGNNSITLKPGETFHLNTPQGTMVFNVPANANQSYTFGFTGFNAPQPVDDFDEFEDFVRDVRKGAGIVDKPKEKKQVLAGPYTPGGQILFSGKMVVKAPKFHGMVHGITGDSNDIKK